MATNKNFNSGYWAALNDVLAYLNTLETKVVGKTKIYHAVFDMRPPNGSN